MPAYSRHELDDHHRTQRTRQPSAQLTASRENRPSPGHTSTYASTLLGDSRLNGRGNQPVKVAMMRQAQQGYGNRAVQRWMAARAQIQRQPEAAPEAPAPQQDTKKKTSTALTFDEVKQLITANNKSTVSTELLICLIWKESGFDPNVKSKSSSATGLMQMTKGAVEQVNKSTPKGIHFEHSEMTDSAKNIDCGSRYLQIRIDWAKGDLTAGLNGYGTGAGYADSILTCETCLTKAPADPTPCLTAIHK
jgi:hypothetical protein